MGNDMVGSWVQAEAEALMVGEFLFVFLCGNSCKLWASCKLDIWLVVGSPRLLGW